VKPVKKEMGMKFSKAISRFLREDPTFRMEVNEETGETLISGMGELHLQVYCERMKREYGVELDIGAPTVNYRETILKKAKFSYLHKK
jgi:elongation factor G